MGERVQRPGAAPLVQRPARVRAEQGAGRVGQVGAGGDGGAGPVQGDLAVQARADVQPGQGGGPVPGAAREDEHVRAGLEHGRGAGGGGPPVVGAGPQPEVLAQPAVRPVAGEQVPGPAGAEQPGGVRPVGVRGDGRGVGEQGVQDAQRAGGGRGAPRAAGLPEGGERVGAVGGEQHRLGQVQHLGGAADGQPGAAGGGDPLQLGEQQAGVRGGRVGAGVGQRLRVRPQQVGAADARRDAVQRGPGAQPGAQRGGQAGGPAAGPGEGVERLQVRGERGEFGAAGAADGVRGPAAGQQDGRVGLGGAVAGHEGDVRGVALERGEQRLQPVAVGAGGPAGRDLQQPGGGGAGVRLGGSAAGQRRGAGDRDPAQQDRTAADRHGAPSGRTNGRTNNGRTVRGGPPSHRFARVRVKSRGASRGGEERLLGISSSGRPDC